MLERYDLPVAYKVLHRRIRLGLVPPYFKELLRLEKLKKGAIKKSAVRRTERDAEIHKARNAFRSAWKLKNLVLKTYGHVCKKCGNYGSEIDHIRPLSKYPWLALEFSNLQVLCKRCNSRKGNKDYAR